MSYVKWIKITTDIFDDEKILLIESLPDAYAIIVVWFKLLCLAGKQNNSGVFMMGQIAYTDKMLATIFRMKESTVTMALQTFEQFGMVEIIGGVITIPNWGKHQNLDQLESKKEYMRNYMKDYRDKQKALTESKPSCKTNSKTNVSSLEEDKEEEIEKDKDKELYNSIISHLNEKAGTKYKATTAKTKSAINARLAEGFNEMDFISVIDKKCAEWLGDEKMEKYLRPETLFGTKFESYLNQKQTEKPQTGRKEIVPKWMQRKDTQPSAESIRRSSDWLDGFLEEQKKQELAERAERLKQELGGA
jgi:uncharacterized phage protein (TIGR02220 family)/predicted phage replisome organizer